MPSHLSSLSKPSNLCNILSSQLLIHRTTILLQILVLLGSGNNKHILALLQQPRQSQLSTRTPFTLGHFLPLLGNLDVLLDVAFLEPGHETWSHVLCFQRCSAGECRCQNTTAQRHGRDDCDTEVAAGGQEVGAFGAFDVEFKGGVADLDGGNSGDLSGAAEGGRGD